MIPSLLVPILGAIVGFLAAGGVGAQEPSVRPPSKIDATIYRELEERGATCVCVELQDPSAPLSPSADRGALAERSARYRRTQQKFLEALPVAAAGVRYRFRYSPVVVLDVEAESLLAGLERSPFVRKVATDRRGGGGLVESRRVIDVDRVHEMGILGEGRTIAVLDTGVDTDHPDLEDAIIHEHHFLDQGADQGDGAEDDNGHGTHVAGIIASRGRVAPLGVAPGSRLVAIKVLSRDNSGWFSDWAAGVEYVTQLHLEDNGIEVDALNLSLISYDLFRGVCDEEFSPLHLAIEAAQEAGIMAFACAGNTGAVDTMPLPGCFSSTVSVGSIPDDAPDRLSSFTNRGPLLDLLAPGERITSTALGGGVASMQGCSFATPHAAAVAGLMREVDPGLDPDTLYELLRTSGTPVFDARSEREYPRLDARRSVLAAGSGAAITRFHRGDANADGRLNLVDPVFSLNFLFLGSEAPPCMDAVDANDDGRVDVADGIFLLQFLAAGGPAPLPPGPPGSNCGFDLRGSLGCERYEACEP